MECGSFYAGGTPIVPSSNPVGYSSPCIPQDPTFVMHQKLDGLLTLFADQKHLLVEAKAETVSLRQKVDILGLEVEKLKERLENSAKASPSSQPKRIPREVSVNIHTNM